MWLILDEGPQVATAEGMPELAQRLGLDLADPLTGHREALAHFLQRVLSLLADPEAQAEDLLFLGRQRPQGALHLGGQVLVEERLVGRAGRLVFQEVAELRVLPDGRLERQRL